MPEPRVARAPAPLVLGELGEEAPELDEERERDEHAERRDRRPVEHVVGDRGGAERDGDQGQERNRACLGEPVVDEPVRGVILPALCHRTPLGEPPDRDERRVEDRDREHEERQQHRGDRRAGGRPARGERQRGEQEPEQLAARVAHERARAAGRPEVEGQEAGAREGEREREDEHEIVLVHRRRVDREVDARDRGERRGQAVHVVEQVERVRDADEPEERDRDAEHVVLDELDAQARGDRDPGGGELRGELRQRAQVADVVEQAGDEDDRAAGEDSRRAPRSRSTAPTRSASSTPAATPSGDRNAAERRCRAVVPTLAGRLGDEGDGRRRGAEQGPQGERRHWEGGDRDDRVHGRKG